MSRNHARRQIDFNKSLIQIDNVDEFYQEDNNDQVDTQTNGEKSLAMSAEKKRPGMDNRGEIQGDKKKQNIVAPPTFKLDNPFEGVEGVDASIFKKRKQQSQYVRVSYIRSIPDPDAYESTDRDLQFLKTLNENISKNVKSATITQDAFEKIIEKWEHDTAKGEIIPLQRAQHLIETMIKDNLKEFVEEIYNYWKGLREEYKRPLLRRYLKVVNKDDNNPNAAFRTRDNPRMKTRKSQRGNDHDGFEKMKTLKQDMEIAMILISNIRQREMLKLEHFELNVMKFESGLKDKQDAPTNSQLVSRFKENYENDKYIQMKHKLKEYQKMGVKWNKDFNKKEEILPEPQPVKQQTIPSELKKPTKVKIQQSQSDELNYDIGAFIATVTEESLSRDITPLKIQNLDLPGANDQMESLIEKPEENKAPVKPRPPNGETYPHPYQNHEAQLAEKQRQQQQLLMKQQYHQQQLLKQREMQQMQPPPEEKNIFRYRIRKRYDRYNRVMLERIFQEDEHDYTAHHKDYYRRNYSQRPKLITPEVADKLHNESLHPLYSQRFQKYNSLYPFNDSDDDQDLAEFTKNIKKNLANSFKAFQKSKKQSSSSTTQSTNAQAVKQ